MYDNSGQRVNEAEEYGAPANPTTGSHDVYQTPVIERGANLGAPAVAGTLAVDPALGSGRIGQAEPRESGSGAVDDGSTGVTTPETLGATPGDRKA